MIVFMKTGMIAEVGTHDELVLNDKDYNNLVNMEHTKQSSSDGKQNLQDMDTPLQCITFFHTRKKKSLNQ